MANPMITIARNRKPLTTSAKAQRPEKKLRKVAEAVYKRNKRALEKLAKY